MLEFYWNPQMDCWTDIEQKIQNASISATAKYTEYCDIDRKLTWVPKIRHSNAAVLSPNAYEE